MDHTYKFTLSCTDQRPLQITFLFTTSRVHSYTDSRKASMQRANQATGTRAGHGVLPKDTHGWTEKELSLQFCNQRSTALPLGSWKQGWVAMGILNSGKIKRLWLESIRAYLKKCLILPLLRWLSQSPNLDLPNNILQYAKLSIRSPCQNQP